MAFSPGRSSLFLALCLLGSFIGCSRQNEGERCSLANRDDDCEGDLVCTDSSKLRKGDDGVDRCCPEQLGSTDNSLCAQRTNTGTGDGDGDTTDSGDGDTTSGGGQGGMSGTEDPADLGNACDYNSECKVPLVCGPSGECQYECRESRDCDSGEVCTAEGTCVAG